MSAAHKAEIDRLTAAATSTAADHAAALERQGAVHDAALRQAHAERAEMVVEMEQLRNTLDTTQSGARKAQQALAAERDDARKAAAAAAKRADLAAAEAAKAADTAASERTRADATAVELSAAAEEAQVELAAAERMRAADARAAEAALEALKVKLSGMEAAAAAAAEHEKVAIKRAAQVESLQKELEAAKSSAITAEKWLDRAAAERSRLLATIATLRGVENPAAAPMSAPSPVPPGSPKPMRLCSSPHPVADTPSTAVSRAPKPPGSPSVIQRASRHGPTVAGGSPKVDRRERQAAIKRFLAARAATPAASPVK